jgi:hypothetical protein
MVLMRPPLAQRRRRSLVSKARWMRRADLDRTDREPPGDDPGFSAAGRLRL